METFNVWWWDPDGGQYKELERVSAEVAMTRVYGLIRSVGGKIGTVKRIIVTDDGDFTNFEWEFGKGVLYPPELIGKM